MVEHFKTFQTTELINKYHLADANIRTLLNNIRNYAEQGKAMDVGMAGDALNGVLKNLHNISEVLESRGIEFDYSEYDINCGIGST